MGKTCDSKDYIRIGEPIDEKGTRPCVRHRPDHTIETGTVTPLQDGQPIHEVISVAPPDESGLSEVQTLVRVDSSGPPKVTSNEYREGWDRVFGDSKDLN